MLGRATFCARCCFHSDDEVKGMPLDKNVFYLHKWALQCGRCINICIMPVRVHAQFVSRPVRTCAHLALALEGGCVRARISR